MNQVLENFKYLANSHVKCCSSSSSHHHNLTVAHKRSSHPFIVIYLPNNPTFPDNIYYQATTSTMRTAAIFAAAIAFVAPVLAQGNAAAIVASLPTCGVSDSFPLPHTSTY
jgi:hypothetical protein